MVHLVGPTTLRRPSRRDPDVHFVTILSHQQTCSGTPKAARATRWAGEGGGLRLPLLFVGAAG